MSQSLSFFRLLVSRAGVPEAPNDLGKLDHGLEKPELQLASRSSTKTLLSYLKRSANPLRFFEA